MSNRTENIWFVCQCFPLDQTIWKVLEFDNNFKIMIMILTYNETGWQEKSPKCQDGLEVLMSNARALETPKKKERTGKIVKWLHFVYVVYTSFLNL